MEKLKQILARDDTVLFIGSGISMWSGLPSWSGMIEELAKFIESAGDKASLVRAEAKKGEFLQAASYGFAKLTEHQRGEFIRATCLLGSAKPHEIHRKIVSLGPRYFITTNYDNLIEESLRKWQPDQSFRLVTNRQLTETAEITDARATNFIFKPHGDAADSESIILTREQYRQLLPQGEWYAALESVKTILLTRPVIYLGFGLRDPDFMYVRDLLYNIYKGGVRDHYAIMADISEEEKDFWRKNYSIHLVNYNTTERPDKTKVHTALLTLLDTLLEKTPILPIATTFDPLAPDVVLALARHAAGLARNPKNSPEFQIRVHAEKQKDDDRYWPNKFDHCSVEKFLDDGPKRALLIGLPGAGKTYAIRRSAARLAEKLHNACLSEPFDEKAVIVPLLADLKLYRGSLLELVRQTLPKSLPFNEVVRHFNVKILIDSFNEMPREYWENGSYESDFTEFISRIGSTSLVIGSRTTDGLEKLGLPAYDLDQIDEKTVTDELQKLGIKIEDRFEREIRQLLQRPFYFQLVTSGAIKLPKDAHPRGFYEVFFENLGGAFAIRFNRQLDIKKTLSLVAYNALNHGEEAFPLSELIGILKTSAETLDLADIDANDIANWLVSSSVLIPHIRGRVAFVHQSVTEYLAATELARQYLTNPYILKEKLSFKRWDQALFLTLSLLPPAQADAFLQDVIKADFALALNAAKYLEAGRDEVVSKLLSEIPERIQDSSEPFDFKIEAAVEFGLPLTHVHEPYLRTLIKCGSSLGSAAVLRLVALEGVKVKNELLQLLVSCYSDYNFCNGIGRALKPFAAEEDAKKLAAWADSIQDTVIPDVDSDDDNDVTGGFISGTAEFLKKLDLLVIRREFLPQDESVEITKIHARILCEILEEHHSTAALDFAGELLLRGIKEAVFAIYIISNFGKPDPELSWASFTEAHVDHLEAILYDSNESWGLCALKCLCAARLDLAEVVLQKASKKSGIEKAALLYCVSPADFTPVFQALSELIKMSDDERHEIPVHILKQIDLDWAGRDGLFVQLLRLRDVQLASALFGSMCPPSIPTLENLEIGPIDWWLEWMLEMGYMDDYWFPDQLGGMFAGYLDHETKDKFVAEFNMSGSKYRRLLLRFVLPYRNDLTTEVFSKDAISFLLADLSRDGSVSSFRGHLLGKTATEQFITERLLPLLPNAEQPLLNNIHKVLNQASSRHGKRYIVE